jgi:phosphoribosylformimino-5-aminoimidazole carboxamide ribotide isomerase
MGTSMRILPVLDIMAGQVVRGIGGLRHEYRPIVSQLTTSTAPLDVALAIRRQFGLADLYIADLDAIAGGLPALATYAGLRAAGLRLWVDAGLRYAAAAASLPEAGVDVLVFGLETLHDPSELARACDRYGPRVVFSLDLRDGEPLGDRKAWEHGDAASVVEQAVAAGARRLIVLDLTRVGTCAGVGTEVLCQRIVQSHPSVEVIAGGGVRGVEDLRRLQACGVGGVLLASALHDGRLLPEELREFTGRP